MYDLMEKLVKLVPEIKDKENEVLATIKTQIHQEKYITWKYIVDKFYESPSHFKHRVIDPKIETHKIWNNYERNLDWANKY